MDMDISSISMSSASDLSDPPSSNPPSSPLSMLSRSPTISPRTSMCYDPCRLPSPPSTITSPGSASPMKSSDRVSVENEIHVNPSGPPPSKRRRIERKPRTTEYLDLKGASEQNEKDERLLEQLTNALRKKKKIVVIAGAGISVSAGIPDFRSSKGLFATLPKDHKLKGSGKHLFDASVYKHDSTTSSFHTMVRDLSHLTKKAEPTPFHHLIASLAKEGRLLRLYTQNVDGLDTSMPPLATTVPLNTKGPWPKTVQLHGGLAKMVCSKCSEISDFNGSLFEGPEAPLCKGCEETDNVRTSHAGKRSHGIGRLRPRMVLYNEYNPDEESIANVVRADIRARPDAIIVVGTSMKIPGVRNMVKDMCRVTRDRKDGITAWINLEPEPTGADLKNCWDLVVQGKCDDVASLVHLPRYDENIGETLIIDEKKYAEDVRGVKLEVEIRKTTSETVKEESRDSSPVEAIPQSIGNVQGMPTPSASPKVRAALPTSKPRPKQSRLTFSGVLPPATTGSVPKDKKKVYPFPGVLIPASVGSVPKDGEKVYPFPGVLVPVAASSIPKDNKKASQRKSRQNKKAEPKPPKATINKTFKATKASTVAPSKIPAKRDFEPEPEPEPKSEPTVLSPRSVMREEFSLRPRSKPINETVGPQKTAEIAPPTTPTQQTHPSPPGTISPTSKPRGFASLID